MRLSTAREGGADGWLAAMGTAAPELGPFGIGVPAQVIPERDTAPGRLLTYRPQRDLQGERIQRDRRDQHQIGDRVRLNGQRMQRELAASSIPSTPPPTKMPSAANNDQKKPSRPYPSGWVSSGGRTLLYTPI